MIYLILSILCSTAIFLLFKAFGNFKLNTFQAIVSNYLVAASCGIFLAPDINAYANHISEEWMIIGLSLGVLFIGLFYLMAYTSQHVGVSAASVSTKMSLVLSMIFFVFLDPQEDFTIYKAAGLALAIPGVFLASVKKVDEHFNIRFLIFPFIIFVGSAVIDSAIGYCEKAFLHGPSEQAVFASLPFIGAFSIGSLVLLIRRFSLGERFRPNSLVGGLFLGIVNYGSIYFLILAFDAELLDVSAMIPVNNLGVVVLSSLAAVIVYKEQLSNRNKLGIALSLIALLVLSFRP